jgi:hypothetical protein
LIAKAALVTNHLGFTSLHGFHDGAVTAKFAGSAGLNIMMMEHIRLATERTDWKQEKPPAEAV